MGKFIDIPEGRLNDFLVHGVFILIAGVLFFGVSWAITVMLFVLGFALFRTSSGIEIDPEGRRIRVYKAVGKIRAGRWLNADGYDTIIIRYTNESQTMGGRGPELTVRVRTYDMYLVGQQKELRLFHEFVDYAKARRSADAMVGLWSMQLTDEVQERRQLAKAKAPERRR